MAKKKLKAVKWTLLDCAEWALRRELDVIGSPESPFAVDGVAVRRLKEAIAQAKQPPKRRRKK